MGKLAYHVVRVAGGPFLLTFEQASNNVLIYGEGRLQVVHHLLEVAVLALQIRDLQSLLVLGEPHRRLGAWVIVAEVARHVCL